MDNIFLTLSADPPHPTAGKKFKVIAKLDNPAAQGLVITFEKHRVYVDQSGTRDLCVIEPGYFTDDGFPGPIQLKQGDTQGATTVNVRADAENPPCPPKIPSPPLPPPKPVTFPDRLMLTAFVEPSPGQVVGKEHLVVTIRGRVPGSN